MAKAQFQVGELVEVLDSGLAMLRSLCTDMPPNHHGRVSEVRGDEVFVEFPINGGYEHSQIAPYPSSGVRKRSE